MGHRIGWNPEDVKGQLATAASELLSPYNDGWTQWQHKQKLYEIKFYLDAVLDESPTFTGERTWLEEQHKKQTWAILTNDS